MVKPRVGVGTEIVSPPDLLVAVEVQISRTPDAEFEVDVQRQVCWSWSCVPT